MNSSQAQFTLRSLGAETWPDFAALASAHDGVWGGCWCLAFHAEHRNKGQSAAERRDIKQALVRAGRAHAALVYDRGECVGWAQFGPPVELPKIKNRAAYDVLDDPVPDWRITCLFVGKGHRGRGVAHAAVAGALDLIAVAGGGLVEAFPEKTEGRKVSGSFLWNGTFSMYEALGFERAEQIGKHKWVVRRHVSVKGT